MKKEVVIAIIVGFSLGLVITYGVYRAQRSLTQKAAQDEVVESTSDTTQASNQNTLLSITQPENGTITDQDSIVVGGITQRQALVTLISSSDHEITQADEIGNFSAELSLEAGPNTIQVISFDQAGNRQEKTISIVYSSYDFEEDANQPEEE